MNSVDHASPSVTNLGQVDLCASAFRELRVAPVTSEIQESQVGPSEWFCRLGIREKTEFYRDSGSRYTKKRHGTPVPCLLENKTQCGKALSIAVFHAV